MGHLEWSRVRYFSWKSQTNKGMDIRSNELKLVLGKHMQVETTRASKETKRELCLQAFGRHLN